MTHEVPCDRCLGRGRIAGFSHVQGGVCFKCGGSGVLQRVATTPAAEARRAKAKAKRAAEQAQRVAEGNARAEARRLLYENDPRIGPLNRRRAETFPAVAYEIYKLLEQIDAGTAHPTALLTIRD